MVGLVLLPILATTLELPMIYVVAMTTALMTATAKRVDTNII